MHGSAEAGAERRDRFADEKSSVQSSDRAAGVAAFPVDGAGTRLLSSNNYSIDVIVFCAVADEYEDGGADPLGGVDFRHRVSIVATQRAGPAIRSAGRPQPADQQADSGDTEGTVSRSRMRELRYRSPAPYVQQTGSRAVRDIPLDGFRIDRSADLVAVIGSTGRSRSWTHRRCAMDAP